LTKQAFLSITLNIEIMLEVAKAKENSPEKAM